jgi:hypothetical protein
MKDNTDIEVLLLKISQPSVEKEKEILRQQLVILVNDLLVHDFQKLVLLLYRVDVSEKKLKGLIQLHPQTDAAEIIADLLIERQEEKKKSRASFKKDRDIPEDEKW